MAKLSKVDTKNHNLALKRLKEGDLTNDEIIKCYEDLNPGATTNITAGSAFFTPWGLACELQLETSAFDSRPHTVLDLCAGFGILSFARKYRSAGDVKLTCLEINPEYVEIGKKLLPDAEWICGDVFDAKELLKGRKFDEFISNPPFGPVPIHAKSKFGKATSRFEYAVAEIGIALSRFNYSPGSNGTMIVQQGITNWKFSGVRSMARSDNPAYRKWVDESKLVMGMNCGIDTTCCEGFKDTNVKVEIVCVEFRTEGEY